MNEQMKMKKYEREMKVILSFFFLLFLSTFHRLFLKYRLRRGKMEFM